MKKCIIPRAMRSIVPRRNNAERGHNGRKWLHESSAGGILCAGGAKPGNGSSRNDLWYFIDRVMLLLAVYHIDSGRCRIGIIRLCTGKAKGWYRDGNCRARMLDLWIAYFGLSDHRKFVFVANQNTILKEIQQLSALSGSLKI